MGEKKWEVRTRLEARGGKLETKEIIEVLLGNRGIRTEREKAEFFCPTRPETIEVKNFKLSAREVGKAVRRIVEAKKKGEGVVVYGDYDADGICATAIMWEALDALGVEALPYIPERVSEGYGLNAESIKKLKAKDPKLKLIVTVDNGVVALEAIGAAKKLGIEVIVTDHHKAEKKLPRAAAIVHTTEVSGSAVAWILARELGVTKGLELVAIGTVADQIPLLGVNRSLVKYGLKDLNKTRRLGLLALLEEAVIEPGKVGSYEINYMIAPRINAMGRLAEGMDSLRLLCTRREERARELARELGRVNRKRQKMVEEAYMKAESGMASVGKIIFAVDETYHEGVIGLIASGLVEKFYRPAIVFSRGETISKASARSVAGFDMIETIREMGEYLIEGGGHPMAAGFTIETASIEVFQKGLEKIAEERLTEGVLERKLMIDAEIGFGQLGWELVEEIEKFEPLGLGNPAAVFATHGVEVVSVRAVGQEGKHLKLILRNEGREYEGIGFGLGRYMMEIKEGESVGVAYSLERNIWNGRENLQLKIKDIKLAGKE